MARATTGNARLGCARVIRRTRRRVGAALDRRFRSVNERVESVGSRVDTGARLETLEKRPGHRRRGRRRARGRHRGRGVGRPTRALPEPPAPHPRPGPIPPLAHRQRRGPHAGHELARGAWLTDFDDDDHPRPNAIGRNLALARERRLEVAYGPLRYHHPDGTVETMATHPPALGRFATQGALVHGGLSFFERTPAAAIFDVSNDWFRIEAMLRAGVRFGMHDEIVFDCFPFLRGHPELKRTEGHAPAPVLRPAGVSRRSPVPS